MVNEVCSIDSYDFIPYCSSPDAFDNRYEREVNHGHRSAIKKILEGDALCSSMMILCISAVHYCPYKKLETLDKTKDKPIRSTSIDDLGNPVKHEVAKIELTDGW